MVLAIRKLRGSVLLAPCPFGGVLHSGETALLDTRPAAGSRGEACVSCGYRVAEVGSVHRKRRAEERLGTEEAGTPREAEDG